MALVLAYVFLCIGCGVLVAFAALWQVPSEKIPKNWGVLNFLARTFFIWVPLWPIILADLVNPNYRDFNSPIDITWSRVWNDSSATDLLTKTLIFWLIAPIAIIFCIGFWLLSNDRLSNFLFGEDAD